MMKEKDGLRNRRANSTATATRSGDYDNDNDLPPSSIVPNDEGDSVSAQSALYSRHSFATIKSTKLRTTILALKWIIHLAAVACFVIGIILRTNQLHTGEECDMTYSMRVFLKVDTTAARSKNSGRTAGPASSQYGLYKFVDQRDPRYSQLLQEQKVQNSPLSRDQHCANSSNNIVVYVPGHWGTYDQARSLGAHGTGMTRARENTRRAKQKLMDYNPNSTRMEDFVYDVYSVDFDTQGGGLHGQFFRYQTEYLAAVLQQLSEDCGTQKKLHLVAHSMGGYVARKVLQDHPGLSVTNVITLATPHSNPLYAFDKSVADFHRELQNGRLTGTEARDKRPLVVSISGGLRDEMIEPSACELSPRKKSSRWGTNSEFGNSGGLTEDGEENDPESLTILASRLLAAKPKGQMSSSASPGNIYGLGMDHRAIVWCHQVLEDVRRILFVLVASSESTEQERLEKVRVALGAGSETFDYSKDLNGMKKQLANNFGSISSICIQSSMIYNLPYLLALYAVLVGFRCARVTMADRASSMFPVWATILTGWVFRGDLVLSTTVILVLVANSLNLVITSLMPAGFFLRRRCSQKELKPPLGVLRNALVTTFALILLVALTVIIAVYFQFGLESRILQDGNWFDLLASTLYLYFIASIYVFLNVWAGFIEDDRAEKSNDKKRRYKKDKDYASFDIQLISFVMLVVPFVIAGPLYLMASEYGTQTSSWFTLLSLQVPTGILVSIKLSQINVAKFPSGIQDDEGAEARRITREAVESTLRRRSILICLCLLFLCCREPGILTPGNGYLVPVMAIMLVWVGIGQILLL